MELEKLFLEMSAKYGLSKGLVMILLLQLLTFLKEIKLSHLKQAVKILLDKKLSTLKKENEILVEKLAASQLTLDKIITRNKRDIIINKVLNSFRDKFNLGYVSIIEFHNGKVNLAQDCLYRYTMTYSAYHPFGHDIKAEHEDQSLVKFSPVIEDMINNIYFDSNFKDYMVMKVMRERSNIERDIMVFLKDKDKTLIFGALWVSLIADSTKDINYKEYMDLIKTELEEIYYQFREHENNLRLDKIS